jgi:hypothetical protein
MAVDEAADQNQGNAATASDNAAAWAELVDRALVLSSGRVFNLFTRVYLIGLPFFSKEQLVSFSVKIKRKS